MYNPEFLKETHEAQRSKETVQRVRKRKDRYKGEGQLPASAFITQKQRERSRAMDAEYSRQMKARREFRPTLTSMLCGDPVGPHQQRWRQE